MGRIPNPGQISEAGCDHLSERVAATLSLSMWGFECARFFSPSSAPRHEASKASFAALLQFPIPFLSVTFFICTTKPTDDAAHSEESFAFVFVLSANKPALYI